MATIPLVALDLKTQGPSPLDIYSKAQSIIGQQSENQLRQAQVQQAQLSLQDQQAATKAMQKWDGRDYNDIPQLIRQAGGSLNAVLDATQKVVARQQQMATLDETTLKNTQARNDQYRGRIQSIIDADPSQQDSLWTAEIAKERAAGTQIQPGIPTDKYPGDDTATFIANHFALGSTLAKEAIDAKQAAARQTSATAAAGELDLRTKEWKAKTDPNSPQYDPSAAFLAKKAAAGDPEAQSILAQQAKQTGAKAGAEAAAKFPYELQLKQQELAQNPVFATNPKTNQRELTTVADAKANGYTNPTNVKQSDIEKESQLNSQVNDMQLNQSRYRTALNAMGDLSAADRMAMTHILSDPSVNNLILQGAGFPAVISMAEQSGKGRDWNALSPDKQDALIGYLRMKNTGLLAQKVLTGMGRASKEALDIELANMPSPIEGATVGNKKLDAWQQNIDQMASRTVKLPWMEQPSDVRARIEGQATDQYNKTQAGKPQGQYRGTPSQDTGKKAYEPGMLVTIHGVSRTVSKVYSDGTFDAQ